MMKLIFVFILGLVQSTLCDFTIDNLYAVSNFTISVPLRYQWMSEQNDGILLFSFNNTHIEIQPMDKVTGTLGALHSFVCDKRISQVLGERNEFWISVSQPTVFDNQTVVASSSEYSLFAKFEFLNGTISLLYQTVIAMSSVPAIVTGGDGTLFLGGNLENQAALMRINDTDGTTLWSLVFGQTVSLVTSLAVDYQNQTLYAAGTTRSGLLSIPPCNPTGGQDFWLTRSTYDGAFSKATVLGTPNYDEAFTLLFLNNSLFLTGITDGTNIIQNGEQLELNWIAFGATDLVVMKINPDTLLLNTWTTLGTPTYDSNPRATADKDGNILLTAYASDHWNIQDPYCVGDCPGIVVNWNQELHQEWLFLLNFVNGDYLFSEGDMFYLLASRTENYTNMTVIALTDKCTGNTQCSPKTSTTGTSDETTLASTTLDSNNATTSNTDTTSPKNLETSSDNAVIAAAVAGGGFLLLIAGVISFLVVRSRKQRLKKTHKMDVEMSPKGPPTGETHYQEIPSLLTTMPFSTARNQSLMIVDDIQIGSRLGGGFFGDVYKGLWHGVTPVALKRLKDPSMFKEFVAEAQVLQNLSMPFIVRFFGICSDEEGHQYIVTEFMSQGSMKDFLDGSSQKLTITDLLLMIRDIAAGMKFMAAKGFIHRDLAARNILVKKEDGRYVAKVADFGLARLTQSSYYSKGGMLPIKWCAPEILTKEKYSTKSDVWAFGVLLWEIFEVGQAPYPGKTNEEVVNMVVYAGTTLPQPATCPPEVWNMILKCWNFDPTQRPTFEEIYLIIANLTSQMTAEETGMTLPEFEPSTYFTSVYESASQVIERNDIKEPEHIYQTAHQKE